MKYLIILPLFLLITRALVFADAIYLKDGQEIRGVITEDYNDRMVISTEAGEPYFLKKDIERIYYDAPEQNLVKLAGLYKEKGEYKAALYYYQAASKRNPSMKEALDGALLMNNMIFAQKESELKDRIDMKQDTEENMGHTADEVEPPAAAGRYEKELLEKAGMSLNASGPDIKVEKVVEGSLADEAGVDYNDTIVAVWGKVIKYMQLDDVYKLFLDNKIGELKIVVGRDIQVDLNKGPLLGGAEYMLGGRLTMSFEGLMVDEVKSVGPLSKAGARAGDMVTYIEDIPTRYMPLESVYKIIEGTKIISLKTRIQREITLWKK